MADASVTPATIQTTGSLPAATVVTGATVTPSAIAVNTTFLSAQAYVIPQDGIWYLYQNVGFENPGSDQDSVWYLYENIGFELVHSKDGNAYIYENVELCDDIETKKVETFASSASFTLPSGYDTGDLGLIFVCQTSDVSSPQPTATSGWTLITSFQLPDTSGVRIVRLSLFGRELDGTEGTIVINSGVARTEWRIAPMWITGKLNGDTDGGWFDARASNDANVTVPSMTSDRTDNLYLYWGTVGANEDIQAPSGFTQLERLFPLGSWNDAVLASKLITTMGSTGAVSGTVTGDPTLRAGCIGVLVPYQQCGSVRNDIWVGQLHFG